MSRDPRMASMAQVDTNIFVGNAASANNKDFLQNNKITAIVSLYDPITGPARNDHAIAIPLPAGNHLRIPCTDISTMDLLAILNEACNFIESQCGKPTLVPKPDWNRDSNTAFATENPGRVLIQCHKGLSRAPSVVMAYLMRKHHQSLYSVMAEMRKKRDIRPRNAFQEQLQLWEDTKYEPWEENDKGEKVPKRDYADLLERLKLRNEKAGNSSDNSWGDSSSDDSEPSPKSGDAASS